MLALNRARIGQASLLVRGLSFAHRQRILMFGNCCVVPSDWRNTPVGASPLFSFRVLFRVLWQSQTIDLMAFAADRVRGVAERVAASSGLEIVNVELRGGGKARMLRIVIDKPAGVTHEDCVNVSREVSTILDVEDAVSGGSYLLEVSSPGLDRELFKPADYERFTGSLVKLTTRQSVNGNRHFEGRLESFRNGRLTLELSKPPKKGKPVESAEAKLEIELANVEKANLVPEL